MTGAFHFIMEGILFVTLEVLFPFPVFGSPVDLALI